MLTFFSSVCHILADAGFTIRNGGWSIGAYRYGALSIVERWFEHRGMTPTALGDTDPSRPSWHPHSFRTSHAQPVRR